MFQYLSRFLVQVLPSVTATVIGGFIVHTWINPRSAADAPRPAIASKAVPENSLDAEASAGKSSDEKPDPKPANVKGVATQSRDAPVREAASTRTGDVKLRSLNDVVPQAADSRHAAKAASTEKPVGEKAQARPATPALMSDVTSAIAAPAEDKRNANDLARTALERLRSGGDASKAEPKSSDANRQGAIEARATETQKAQPAFEPVYNVTSQPVVLPMGPPINIAAPRYSEAAIDTRTPRDGESERMVPPGEIPVMRRAAEAREERTTIADDVMSATRSVLRAVLPR